MIALAQRHWLSLFVFVVLATALATYRDYGISWDEYVQSEYGQLALRYYSSGGEDKSCLEFRNLRFYGPVFEMAAAALHSETGMDRFFARHLLSALMGVLTLVGVAVYAGMAGGRVMSFAATLCLLMTPVFYGHWYINSKDIPFAALFVWSMVFTARLLGSGGATWKNSLSAGLAMGLTAAIRPTGVALLLGMLAVGVGYRIVAAFLPSGHKRPLAPLLLMAFFQALLTVVIMTLLWPLAHTGLANLMAGIGEGMKFSIAYPTLFAGHVILSDRLPSLYVLEYIVITTPVFALAMMVGAMGAGALEIWEKPGSDRSTCLFLLFAWFFAPILFFMFFGANIYDRLRHFLFVLPAVAIFAGLAAQRLAGLLAGRRAMAAIFAMAILFCLPLPEMIRLHPYQYAYFNFLVGGVKGASGRYETEYWSTSNREAMEYINTQSGGKKVRVLAAANDFNKISVTWYAAPNVEVQTVQEKFGDKPDLSKAAGPDGLPEGFDYYLATYRFGMSRAFPQAPVEFAVKRSGAVFAVVKGRLR